MMSYDSWSENWDEETTSSSEARVYLPSTSRHIPRSRRVGRHGRGVAAADKTQNSQTRAQDNQRTKTARGGRNKKSKGLNSQAGKQSSSGGEVGNNHDAPAASSSQPVGAESPLLSGRNAKTGPTPLKGKIGRGAGLLAGAKASAEAAGGEEVGSVRRRAKLSAARGRGTRVVKATKAEEGAAEEAGKTPAEVVATGDAAATVVQAGEEGAGASPEADGATVENEAAAAIENEPLAAIDGVSAATTVVPPGEVSATALEEEGGAATIEEESAAAVEEVPAAAIEDEPTAEIQEESAAAIEEEAAIASEGKPAVVEEQSTSESEEEGAVALPENGAAAIEEESTSESEEEGAVALPEDGAAVMEEVGAIALPENGAAFIEEESTSESEEEGAVALPENGAAFIEEESSSESEEEGAVALPENGAGARKKEHATAMLVEVRARGSESGNLNGSDEGATSGRQEYIPRYLNESDGEEVFSGGVTKGINFDRLDQMKVTVTGVNIPDKVDTFQQAQLSSILMRNINRCQYERPTPVQKYAMPIILAGRDMMACAQTGSGKTAAFFIPIVHSLLKNRPLPTKRNRMATPQVLIITPTRELAIQTFNEAKKFTYGTRLRTHIAYGGTSVNFQIRKIMSGCNILIATPGRLTDFLRREIFTLREIRHFIIDEADKLLDLSFLGDMEDVFNHSSITKGRRAQVVMFSATFPEEIRRMASNYMKKYLFVAVGVPGAACTDVEQRLFWVPKYEKRGKLVELLSTSEKQKTLIFVHKKRTADILAVFLSEKNFPSTSMHGDREQSLREQALHDFKTGKMDILVATAVAARGLDINNVAHVINYDLPKTIEEYIHRIGRTGRMGNRGLATSFFDVYADFALIPGLVTTLVQAKQVIPDFLYQLVTNRPPPLRGIAQVRHYVL